MPRNKIDFLYNILMVVLLAAIAASFFLGLTAVLHAISIMFAAGLTLAILGAIGFGIAVFGWFTIRDAIAEMQEDRHSEHAWYWRIFAYAAVVGMFVEGSIGAWKCYL